MMENVTELNYNNMENKTLPEGYFEALDINGNGLVKIAENTYESTRTGNKYFYNGEKLLLIEEYGK
jgi:hypothetical protein